jgi:hypothetical protein
MGSRSSITLILLILSGGSLQVRAIRANERCHIGGKFARDVCTSESAWIVVGRIVNVVDEESLRSQPLRAAEAVAAFTVDVVRWEKGPHSLRRKRLLVLSLSHDGPRLPESTEGLYRIYGNDAAQDRRNPASLGVNYIERLEAKI